MVIDELPYDLNGAFFEVNRVFGSRFLKKMYDNTLLIELSLLGSKTEGHVPINKCVMKYSAFFFDFDGVLADSVDVKTKAFAKLFEPYGPEIEAMVVEHHRRNGGMPRRDKFRHYYNAFIRKPLEEKALETLCNEFSSLVVDEVVTTAEIPGAKDFLEEWSSKVDCFVVSATPDDEIVEIVDRRGLKSYFREILGSSRSKQQNLRHLMEKYSLAPTECLFFGDAESDYRAAKVCNVGFFGIVPGPDAPLLQVAPQITWARNFLWPVVQDTDER